MKIPTMFIRCFLWLLAVWICLSTAAVPAQAAVTITSFTASWVDTNVLVAWETATEVDNAGFYVQRSDSQNGAYTRISPLIPSIGDQLTGATYQFTDANVTTGITYWYKVEAIDLSQQSEFHGPVSASPNALTPSPTTTGTLVNTPTLTFTPTSTLPISPTASLTPTGTQAQSFPTATTSSGTAYPAPLITTVPGIQPTNAALQPTITVLQPTQSLLATPVFVTTTGAVTSTAVLSPTTTLIPLPDITLTFPAGGILIQERGTATANRGPARLTTSNLSWNPFGGVMLLSVIVTIWILLGVWFYMTFRRIE